MFQISSYSIIFIFNKIDTVVDTRKERKNVVIFMIWDSFVNKDQLRRLTQGGGSSIETFRNNSSVLPS